MFVIKCMLRRAWRSVKFTWGCDRCTVTHPEGFFGPSYAGYESVVLRGVRIARRVEAGKKPGAWRRVDEANWRFCVSRFKTIEKERWCLDGIPSPFN